MEHDINFISLSGSLVSNNGEATDGISDSNRDACSEEKVVGEAHTTI